MSPPSESSFVEELRALQRQRPASTSKRKKTEPKQTPAAVVTGEQSTLPVNVASDAFTDMRMAETFANKFVDKIRYWPEIGKWLIFDGRRWTTDEPGSAFPFVREMISDLYLRAATCDFSIRADTMKSITKLEAHPRQETILAAARTRQELIVTTADLDRHPMLLTCGNGTLDLGRLTYGLRAHRADDFITRMVSIDYVSIDKDQDPDCPLFLNFLNQIFDGNQDIIDYLQRFAGYCLTGRTGEQILLFFYGLGCNGKSVLANVLGALLGDLASTSGSNLLMAKDNRNSSNDVAALRGARLVKVSEFDDGERLAEAQIKTLTGGDPVSCRFLYQEYFTYTPTYKILLIGNHKPKVRGTDHGIWRRLHLLNFGVTIPEEERDPSLQDKLMTELPGILTWAVQGCLEWQKTGLSAPQEIKAAVDEYRKSEDIFDQWLEECCIKGDHIVTPAADLLASFIEFSKWRGTTPQKLGRMLTEAGFVKEKTGIIKWRGLGLLQTTSHSHWQDRE